MAAQFESPKFSLMVMTTIPFSPDRFLPDFIPGGLPDQYGIPGRIPDVSRNRSKQRYPVCVDTVNQYRIEMDRDTALIEAGATLSAPGS